MLSKREARDRIHILVTIWPSAAVREQNGSAIRVTYGSLSNGAPVVIYDRYSNAYTYTPDLLTKIEIEQSDTISPNSVSFDVFIGEVANYSNNYGEAVGEISVVRESDCSIVNTWENRERKISGEYCDVSKGVGVNPWTITLQGVTPKDNGRIYPRDLVIDEVRFPQVTLTGDRDRALNSVGLRPIYPIYSTKSSASLDVPLCVIQNDSGGEGGADYLPYKYMASYDPIATYDPTITVLSVDQTEQERDTFTIPAIFDSTDALGNTYYYVNQEPVSISGSVSFTNGLATITASFPGALERYFIQGDVIVSTYDYVTLGSDNDWAYIEDFPDGTNANLESVYSGTTGTTFVYYHALPPSLTYPCYATNMGIYGLRGTAINDVVQFAEWLISRMNTNYNIDIGSLLSIEKGLRSIYPNGVINEDYVAFDFFMDNIGSYLPINIAIVDGNITFMWDGIEEPSKSVTTIDIDSDTDVHIDGAITYSSLEDIVNEVYSDFEYSIRYQRFSKYVTVTDEHSDIPEIQTSGRSTFSKKIFGVKREELELPFFGDIVSATQIMANKIYRKSKRTMTLSLSCTCDYRWISLGEILTIVGEDLDGTTLNWKVIGTKLSEDSYVITCKSLPF